VEPEPSLRPGEQEGAWQWTWPVPAWLVSIVGIVAPVVIAVTLPNPVDRPVIPAVLTTLVVATLAVLHLRTAAVLSAVVAGVSFWFFDLPPTRSFEVRSTEDGFAIAAIFVLELLSALLLGGLTARDKTSRRQAIEERAAAAADRATLNAVQAAILPRVPLGVDGVDVTTSYRMGGAASGKLGGDFYVLVPLANGSLGVGIGDVAGHGPSAVGAMAELRMTLRAVANITPDPALALQRLEFILRTTNSLSFATVLYGIVDPVRQSMTWVNAGHVPPIIRHADGSTEVLDGTNAGAMCARRDPMSFPVNRTGIRAGDTLVLYTDGLVETRTDVIDDGIDRVRAALRDDFATGSELTTRLMTTVAEEPDDDIAILVAQVGSPQRREPRPKPRGTYFARRPSKVRARPAEQGEILETPLGIWTATRGDWVVSNPNGTQLVPSRTFDQLFDPDPEPPVRTVSRHFPNSDNAVKAARDFVGGAVEGLEIDRSTAVLLTSELATNAVRHADTEFDVIVSSHSDGVEIAVSDASNDEIRPAYLRREAAHGRGLTMVDMLADEWGTTRTHDAKVVWFWLRRRPADQPARDESARSESRPA
jgi:serine phosphatase RsbU (regulator of sigma subunit)/anti-sigma regulatory factor (Ser/Thr protein kinase)